MDPRGCRFAIRSDRAQSQPDGGWGAGPALDCEPDGSDRRTTCASRRRQIGWIREAAGSRFDQIELNLNLMAVGEQVPRWIASQMGLTAERLARAGAVRSDGSARLPVRDSIRSSSIST